VEEMAEIAEKGQNAAAGSIGAPDGGDVHGVSSAPVLVRVVSVESAQSSSRKRVARERTSYLPQ